MSAYKAQAYTSAQVANLGKIPIKAQTQVKALPNYNGKALDLQEAFEAISSHSSDFAEQSNEAQEVDKLLHAVLVKRGFFVKEAKPQATITPTPSVTDEAKAKKLKLAKAKLKLLAIKAKALAI